MMRPTVIYESFSVVVVPFPFIDKTVTKRRPALMLSSKEHPHHSAHVTLLMITSAKQSAWSSDYMIKDLARAGLPTPSIARQKIFTIESQLIIDLIGTLSTSDRRSLKACLRSHLVF